MGDNAELIRQQMDATKSQLSDKLQQLELQIAETAQSTGTAVNATVEAVKDTVETVQGVAQRFSNTFDVRRKISRHPWLTLGACAGLGYLIGSRSRKKSLSIPPMRASMESLPNQAGAGAPVLDAAASSAAITAAYERGLRSSSWDLLRSAALAALIEIVQDAASRVVPRLLDSMAGTQPEGDQPAQAQDAQAAAVQARVPGDACRAVNSASPEKPGVSETS